MILLARMFVTGVLAYAAASAVWAVEPITIGVVDEMTGPKPKRVYSSCTARALQSRR